MELINVCVAALVAFVAGAGWYMALAEPWMQASGIARGPDGQPEGGGMKPSVMVLTFVMQLVVAGMMRHVFVLGGIDTLGAGLVGGLGIGLFLIAPWIALNNANAMKPAKLTLIDGGYATLACMLMGGVLTLF
ncbi:DUF1761 domain-containing protein [Pseudoponticoccus marisrubri]|uniref:DUF1761 domain-containing protein n=1 Tax=Pseudoponticoccus marisrubri TaxID=1685382 RepID=A0A0W7WG49_9RHOB|nr:DUF1761 domain-containing protein [Pseudoponticoccus marisrubri]KUF09627.1 hypothetical protein AVJ23_16630 [Pseudoponticoccus marisrubri]